MATLQSQFKIREMDGFGGSFVDSAYLASAYDADKPHEFENTMVKVFSASDRFSSKPLLNMTQGKGKVEEIENEVYRWWLKGFEEKSFRIVENLEEGNENAGMGITPFKIKIDEGWVHRPDVLILEDNNYHLQILDGPVDDGDGFIYTVQLQTDNPNKYVPSALLQPGRELSKGWTSVSSEYNEDYGTHQYSAPFQLESQLGYFAEEFSVTDKACRKKIVIPFKFKVGDKVEKHEKIMNLGEAKKWEQFYRDMEIQSWIGEKSSFSYSPQGYRIRTGPGIRQQLADGHTERFSGPLTERMLRDYLMDIYFGRVDEQDRKITVMTGTKGSEMFHDMLASTASSFLTVDTHYVDKIDPGTNHLAYGAQFTKYRGLEGVEVTVMKNPLYDDTRFCKRMHPTETNRPIDSYRMTFLDFGKSDGKDNIRALKEKNSYTYGYVPGTWTPTGPVQGGATSSKKNGYETFCQGSWGIQVEDPSRCGELILDYQDGYNY